MGQDTFETGAQRDAIDDKVQVERIDPVLVLRVSKVIQENGPRYDQPGDPVPNWMKGMPFMRCVGCILRHTFKYMLGWSDEDHLGCIGANVMFLMRYEAEIRHGRFPETLDDRPFRKANSATQLDALLNFQIPRHPPSSSSSECGGAADQGGLRMAPEAGSIPPPPTNAEHPAGPDPAPVAGRGDPDRGGLRPDGPHPDGRTDPAVTTGDTTADARLQSLGRIAEEIRLLRSECPDDDPNHDLLSSATECLADAVSNLRTGQSAGDREYAGPDST